MRTVKEKIRVMTACVVGAVAIVDPALANIDWSKAEAVGTDLTGFLGGSLATTAFIIAFFVTGALAAFNKISWAWVGGVILGAFFVFGGPALVDNLRTSFT